jgi:tRNA-2-methylthio-N6-dimethylallyladenosine synthase
VLVEKAARRGDMLQARTRDFKTVMVPAEGVAVGGYYTSSSRDDRVDVHRRGRARRRARSLPLPMAAAGRPADGGPRPRGARRDAPRRVAAM